MQWWAWIAIGAILLGSELAFIDAEFYLVFVGAAAFVVGLLELTGWVNALWLQWLLFAALSAFFISTFRRTIYQRLRSRLPIMNHGPAGEQVLLPEALAPGQACRLEHRGSSWSAVNGGASALAAGSRARISRVDGLTLIVHADPLDL